jgi:hypothetical protein
MPELVPVSLRAEGLAQAAELRLRLPTAHRAVGRPGRGSLRLLLRPVRSLGPTSMALPRKAVGIPSPLHPAAAEEQERQTDQSQKPDPVLHVNLLLGGLPAFFKELLDEAPGRLALPVPLAAY